MSQCSARVLSTDADHVWVEISPREIGCGNCDQPGGCQSGLFSLDRRSRRYRVANTIGAKDGDQVDLVVPDYSLVRISMMVYGFPTLLLIACAVVGQAFAGNTGAVIGGVFGLVLSAIVLRKNHRYTLENAVGAPNLGLRKPVSSTSRFVEQK